MLLMSHGFDFPPFFKTVQKKSLLQQSCGQCFWFHRFNLVPLIDSVLGDSRLCIANLVVFGSVVLQHYDRRGQHLLALVKIDEAIAHTPTVIDLYSIKVGVISLANSTT